jgi:molybdopterin biosynthesis enzyme MoaB
MRVAILTISDAGARGDRSDGSGDAIAAWVGERGYTLAGRALALTGTDHLNLLAMAMASTALGALLLLIARRERTG